MNFSFDIEYNRVTRFFFNLYTMKVKHNGLTTLLKQGDFTNSCTIHDTCYESKVKCHR